MSSFEEFLCDSFLNLYKCSLLAKRNLCVNCRPEGDWTSCFPVMHPCSIKLTSGVMEALSRLASLKIPQV